MIQQFCSMHKVLRLALTVIGLIAVIYCVIIKFKLSTCVIASSVEYLTFPNLSANKNHRMLVLSFIGIALAGTVLGFVFSLYRRKKLSPNQTLTTTIFDALLELPMMLKIGPWRYSPDIESAMRVAMEETSLTDFGWTDKSGFVERYRIVKAVGLSKTLGRYTPFGHYLALTALVRRMKDRLQLIDYLKKHPVVLQTKLKNPIFVIGLTRTGSTFLHEMLGLSEHAQMHYAWEQLAPVPTTQDESLTAQRQDREKRYKKNQMFVFLVNAFLGERMQSIHRVEYDAPEECTTPCAIGLPWSPSDLPLNVFAIDDLIPLGAGDTFQHYRTFLQLLTWQAPERRDQDFTWVLKCPFYLPYLDALHAEFPGATMVWIHRDPAECVPSACSLFEALLGMGTDQASIDRVALGRAVMHYTHRCLEVAEKTIARLGEKFKISHVRYSEIVKTPKEICRRVYEKAAIPFSGKYDVALDAYLLKSAKKRSSTAAHAYRPEDYGLSAPRIKEEFAAYISKYC